MRSSFIVLATIVQAALFGACAVSVKPGGSAGQTSRNPQHACSPTLTPPRDSPRPIAPLSGTTVTTRRPTLRWQSPAGDEGARVEICSDRACTAVIANFDATGNEVATALDLPSGVVFWRLRPRHGAGVSPTWQFTVGARSTAVDTSWGATLDVNGDGFADVAASRDDETGSTDGVYLYEGSATGLAATPAITLLGPDGQISRFGSGISSAGDVNGDGYVDLLVVALGSDDGHGRAYVYNGGPSGVSAQPAHTFVGKDFDEYVFGQAIAAAGDVNGDGYADVAIAAFRETSGGRVHVFLGGPDGPQTCAAITIAEGIDAGHEYGQLLAGAGDVNGDGFGDLVVSASREHTAWVHLGGPAGTHEQPDVTLETTEVDDGSTDRSVAMLDANGDGYSDVAIATPRSTNGSGKVEVHPGGPDGTAPAPATTLRAASNDDYAFGRSLVSTGDVDGDGYGDLLVGGSYRAESDLSVRQQLSLYRGSESGLRDTAARLRPETEPVDLYWTRGCAEDVNGDGFPDLVLPIGFQRSQDFRQLRIYPGSPAGLSDVPVDGPIVPGQDGGFGIWIAAAPNACIVARAT